jgi:hypothetical protein
MSLKNTLQSEGIHPDIIGQPDFEFIASQILARRRKAREGARGSLTPKEQKAIEFHKKSKLKKRLEMQENYEDSIPELRSRTVSDGPRLTSSERRSRKSPGELMRMLNQDSVKPKKKKKKKDKVEEGILTPFGFVYEDSALPAPKETKEQRKRKMLLKKLERMISAANLPSSKSDVGPRRARMEHSSMYEEFIDPEEGEAPSGRSPLDLVSDHPSSRVRKKAIKGMLKQMQKNYGGHWKSRSKDPVEEGLDYIEEKKLSRTAKRASRAGKPGYDEQGRPKEKGKVRAWDMDETLFRNDPKKIRVHVKDKATGKTTRSLTNQEFNTDKLNKDKEDYDFNEFRSSEKFKDASTPNKSMVKKLKKQVRRGKPVHIVTARGSFDDQPKFAGHLRKHGIEIDKGKGKGGRHVHVHRAGDMEGNDIGEKKVKIVKGLMNKHGSSGAEMYDDAAKVQRAFKKSNKQTPTTQKVKTKMVMPNKKDVSQARSFKEEIDIEFVYNFLLEQLVIEEIAEDYDDAFSILENLDDEILEEYVLEGYEFIQTVLSENAEECQTSKIKYISPYKKLQEKKEIFESYTNVEKVTPYEYWKSFIGVDDEDATEVSEELDESREEFTSNGEMTSYDYWKARLQKQDEKSSDT